MRILIKAINTWLNMFRVIAVANERGVRQPNKFDPVLVEGMIGLCHTEIR